MIVSVKEGEDKPYKCSSGFYIRVGPNSQKLSRNEIVEFFKSEGKIRYDELINPRFDFDTHFDPKKFDRFLRLAGISKVMDTEDILVNLGAAEKQEGKIIFNNTGIFFFSRNLHDIYFHTMVTCALYKGVEKVDVLDRRDFNDDIISTIDRVMNFLKQYIPVRYEIAGEPRRKEIPEVPYEALREAVINAVAHRNYFEKGSNVMVEMFDDRRLKDIIFVLNETEPTTISQLVLKSGISRRTLQRDLVLLKKKHLIVFKGARKTGGYILTVKGKRTAKEMKKKA